VVIAATALLQDDLTARQRAATTVNDRITLLHVSTNESSIRSFAPSVGFKVARSRGNASMRCWWVNQNQTYRHEVQGGYLWSPKRNANGVRNPFYESMREVAPGDLIFSFMDTRILAIGIAQSYSWENPKPLEFGNAGQNWENIGWKVKVNFTELANKVRPKDHIDVLRPLLPQRYSPLQPNGNGLQSVYLTEVPTPLAEVLSGLIGQEVVPLALAAHEVKPVSADDLDFWERKLEQEVANDPAVPETDRVALVRARKGQGLFKVSAISARETELAD
jgi:putative restriction endonuclease